MAQLSAGRTIPPLEEFPGSLAAAGTIANSGRSCHPDDIAYALETASYVMLARRRPRRLSPAHTPTLCSW